MDSFMIVVFIFIIMFTLLGYKFKSLTLTGALAAIIVGGVIQLGFGIKGLVLLGIFFGSSSFWSKFQQREKKSFLDKLEKGEQRDHVQVLANGGIPAGISMLTMIHPSEIWLYVFIVCLAAANADTWASEIGSLSKRKPILITTLKRVDRGTSGAVSTLGTVAAIAGACLIATFSMFLWSDVSFQFAFLFIILGFAGNFVDTLLGATVQVKYRCDQCLLETEKRYHCHHKTVKVKGIPILNNDVINFLAIFGAAILTFLLF